MADRCPQAPLTRSVADVVRGYGRLVAGWPTWDRRRPGGSLQAAVGLSPAFPPSAAGSGTPDIGCAPSRTPPLSSRRGPQMPLGHHVDPSSSSSCAWTNTRKWSSCYSFRSISVWCWVWWRPASDFTSSASGMGWADCMVACRLPCPGFRHQCNAVCRSGRRRWEPANVHFIKINKHKRKAAAPHGWLPHTKHKLKSRPGPLSPFTVVTPFILPKLLRGTRDRWVAQVSFIIIYSTGFALFPRLLAPPHLSQLLTVIIITYY